MPRVGFKLVRLALRRRVSRMPRGLRGWVSRSLEARRRVMRVGMGMVALTEMVTVAEEEEGMVVDGTITEAAAGIATRVEVGGVEGIRATTRMVIVRRGMIAVADAGGEGIMAVVDMEEAMEGAGMMGGGRRAVVERCCRAYKMAGE